MQSPGEKIKELRLLEGMSQEELGQRVGVQRAAIQKYEKGTIENIPIKTIEKIAAVFDVSPTYIVGWNGNSGNPLAMEVKVIQGVKQFFGKESVEILEGFVHLNPVGQRKVKEYMDDMHKIYGEITS